MAFHLMEEGESMNLIYAVTLVAAITIGVVVGLFVAAMFTAAGEDDDGHL